MKTEKDSADGLTPFFEAARRDRPEPSKVLLSRVLADAMQAQAALSRPAQSPLATPRPTRRTGRFYQFFEALGGKPAMAGLSLATCLGLWIGLNPPPPIETMTVALLAGGGDPLWLDAQDALALGLGEELM